MKILQLDPFGDGWWADVELDSGERRLLHVYDSRGRKAPKPSLGDWEALAELASVPLPPLPPDPSAELGNLKAAFSDLALKSASSTKAQLVAGLAALVAPKKAVG